VSTKHDELVVFFQEIPWIQKNLSKDQAADLRRRIDEYERFTRQLLNAGVRSGELRELDPNMIMYSIIGILAYVPNWFRQSSSKSRATLVRELADFVLAGVLAR